MGKAKRGKEVTQKQLRKDRRKRERENKKVRKDRFTKRFQNVNNTRKEGAGLATPPTQPEVAPVRKVKQTVPAPAKTKIPQRASSEVKRRKNIVYIKPEQQLQQLQQQQQQQQSTHDVGITTPTKDVKQVTFNMVEDVKLITPLTAKPPPAEKPKPQAYVPPSLREKNEISPKEKLITEIKSIINRLSPDTIKFCSQEIITLNSKSELSRFDFSQSFNDIIIESICDQVRLVSSFIFPYSALIKIVSASLGEMFSAELCASLCCALQKQIVSSQRNRAINSILLLSHLHATKVTDSILVYSVIRMLSKFKNSDTKELQLELLLVLISVGGMQLKTDNATALKDVSDYIKDKLQRSHSLETSARANVIVELLQAMRTSKGQKTFGAESRRMDLNSRDQTLRTIGAIMTGLHIKDPTVHTITFKLCTGKRIGMWWLSIARGHTKENDDSDSDLAESFSDCDEDEEHLEDDTESEPESEPEKTASAIPINELTAKHRVFNTEIRRILFKTICAAEDSADCLHNLVRLNLKGHDEKELVFVLLHCLSHERIFNRFYFNILNKLSDSNRRWKFTLMYAYWDCWSSIQESDSTNMSQYINISICFALLVKNGKCSLSHMKGASWDNLSIQSSLYMKILWVILTLTIPNLADDIRSSIALNPELDLFRANLQKWIHKAFLVDPPARISFIAKVLAPLIDSIGDDIELDGTESKPEIVTTVGFRLKQIHQSLNERGIDDIQR